MIILKYLKTLGLYFGSLLILSILITTFNYFDWFNPIIIKVLTLLFIVISLFIPGFYIGYNSTSKGYLEGIKIASIISIIHILISFLLKALDIKILILVVIIFVFTILGSIMGINKKQKN